MIFLKILARFFVPFLPVIFFVVLPAIFLPRNKWYKVFLLLPLFFVGLMFFEFFYQYKFVPETAGFVWFLSRPVFLINGIVSALVLVQPFFTLETFRKVVRVCMFLLLMYGGFAFRQDYVDYKQMLARRSDHMQGILNITETTPVLKYDNKLVYLPGAPCRFSADGGYVQGCVMELLQRIMQLDFLKVAKGLPDEVALFTIAFAALALFLILCYVGARWWCGWICPLSTMGDMLGFIRRKLGLPHLKIAHPVKVLSLWGGISCASLGLIFSKFYAHLGADGKFLGCKIPLYPFCKVCPGQYACPIASQGPDGHTGFPGFEWLYGYFKIGSIILLSFFVLGFFFARRIWCRFCPMGMVGGIFNKNALLSLKKNSVKCNQCGTCIEVCPVDIHHVQKEMKQENVSTFECVYCLKCVNHCPQDDCLRFEFCGKEVVNSKFRNTSASQETI